MTATWCGVIGKPISSKVGSSAAAAPAPFNMTAVMAVIENRFFMINLPLRGREPCGKDATMHNVPSQGSPMVRSRPREAVRRRSGFLGRPVLQERDAHGKQIAQGTERARHARNRGKG